MTNEERREKRYQRRKEKRFKRKEDFLNSMPSYDKIFTFEHFQDSYQLCRKEVSQKPSLQIFQQNLTQELTKLLNEIHSEKGFISRGFIEFNICERGKMRHIKSVDIRERVVQRCFCDYYLLPLLTRDLIYDNGASLKNKGVAFSLKRLNYHLKKYYKENHNNEGYILLYDFSNYFGNINHFDLYKIVDPLIKDDKCKKLYHHLVDAFGNVGLGLGSQVSQISAVAYPNKIDHVIENLNYVCNYARYMDDGYAILKTKEDANKCKEILMKEAKKLHIQLNIKKIKICKIKRSFTYLKRRFFLNDKGQVIMRLNRKNIYKHRRKINKLFGLVRKNILTLNDINLSHRSQYGQVKCAYKNKKSIYNIHIQIRRSLDDGQRNSDGN